MWQFDVNRYRIQSIVVHASDINVAPISKIFLYLLIAAPVCIKYLIIIDASRDTPLWRSNLSVRISLKEGSVTEKQRMVDSE